jgi:hypothetical protein
VFRERNIEMVSDCYRRGLRAWLNSEAGEEGGALRADWVGRTPSKQLVSQRGRHEVDEWTLNVHLDFGPDAEEWQNGS